jgi:hypothetical protein
MAQAARLPDDSASNPCQARRIMRIGELIVGLLVLVAVASYGFVAAITLAK